MPANLLQLRRARCILIVAKAPPGLFAGLLCLLVAIGLHEFYTMALPRERRGEALLAVALGVILAATTLFCPHPQVGQGTLVAVVLALTILFLFRYRTLESVGRDLALTVFGLCYVPLLLGHAGLLRQLEQGREWVFLVLLIVMVSDSLAYFVGMALGRHRLYEAISPKKSIEGALGGLAGGVLGALAAKHWVLPQLQGGDVLGFQILMPALEVLQQVSRPRLLKRLDTALDVPLTLVCHVIDPHRRDAQVFH